MRGLARPSADSDMWVPEQLTPSWVCLPNDQPVLTIIKPGESALCVLESICKVRALSLQQVQAAQLNTFKKTESIVCILVIRYHKIYKRSL